MEILSGRGGRSNMTRKPTESLATPDSAKLTVLDYSLLKRRRTAIMAGSRLQRSLYSSWAAGPSGTPSAYAATSPFIFLSVVVAVDSEISARFEFA
jgi:hypothetical protein